MSNTITKKVLTSAIIILIATMVYGIAGFIITCLCVGIYYLRNSIISGIHNVLINVPVGYQIGCWIVLSLIGLIGASTYLFSGIPARYPNFWIYFFSLAITIPYMFRKTPESKFNKFAAFVWAVWAFACLGKLLPFVGFTLAAIDVALFLHLHYIGDRDNQPQPSHHNTGSFSSRVSVGNATEACPWWGHNRDNLWQGNRIYYGYALIPVVRIPNPFVWYCYSEDQGAAYRDTLFGGLDAQEISNIYDCNYPKSGGFYRFIRGTLHLEFDFTKYGKNTVQVWRNINPAIAQKIHEAHAAKKK